MNINAAIAVIILRKCFASPKWTKTHPALPVRARTQKRKSRLLLHLEAPSTEVAFLPAAVVVRAVALLDRGDIQAGREPVFFFEDRDPMKIQNSQAKEKLVQRLRRIEGQVRGVESMLMNERDCREILQQLAAIHSAVQGASRYFLQEYATACLLEMDEDSRFDNASDLKQRREKIIQDMIELLDKAP
jgi:DNA-binding FrmR family transcriptional regulator